MDRSVLHCTVIGVKPGSRRWIRLITAGKQFHGPPISREMTDKANRFRKTKYSLCPSTFKTAVTY